MVCQEFFYGTPQPISYIFDTVPRGCGHFYKIVPTSTRLAALAVNCRVVHCDIAANFCLVRREFTAQMSIHVPGIDKQHINTITKVGINTIYLLELELNPSSARDLSNTRDFWNRCNIDTD